MIEFNLVIPTNKRLGTILFLLVFMSIIPFKMSGKSVFTYVDYILFAFTALAIIYLTWILFGDVRIRIKEKVLIIQKRCLRFPYRTNSFDICKIKHLNIAHNSKADTYWALGRSALYSPEFLKIYDKNPTVIYFEYKEKRIKIGEGLEEFNAELIRNEINQSKR